MVDRVGGSTGEEAIAAGSALDAAFELADQSACGSDLPCIGIFGNGSPETLITACGATTIHVNFGAQLTGPMDAVIEPFVDAEVRSFLNRFASGAFDFMSGIVFARDDAAALTAYQYATERARQGRAPKTVPPLFLFNLVHRETPAAAAFNRIQRDKLLAFLAGRGLTPPTQQTLVGVAGLAARRRNLLETLDGVAPAHLASRWRNAGRFLPLARHVELIEQALTSVTPKAADRPRLALVGSPIAAPGFFELLDSVGDLVCDLQSFGRLWPGPWEVENQPDTILKLLADDAFCPRIVPAEQHRKALVETIVAGGCDLVICQLAQTDDTFGWEMPGLAAALKARGIGFVNLGFRDPTPDAHWLATAGRSLAAALEDKP